jgi:hypothetical protein
MTADRGRTTWMYVQCHNTVVWGKDGRVNAWVAQKKKNTANSTEINRPGRAVTHPDLVRRQACLTTCNSPRSSLTTAACYCLLTTSPTSCSSIHHHCHSWWANQRTHWLEQHTNRLSGACRLPPPSLQNNHVMTSYMDERKREIIPGTNSG